MAITPQEAGQKAYDATMSGGEEQVAILLKQNFQNLSVIYENITIPTDDAEYRRMSKELIDQRQFSVPAKDGKTITITLDDLDKKDDELKLGIKGALGVSRLQDAVPTRDQLHATANAVENGVAANTGTTEFLGGATWGDAFAGFLRWIAGLFTGESSFSMASLKESIAHVTAENMQQTVGHNLENLRAAKPEMQHILTDETIAAISRQTHDRVLQEAGVAEAHPEQSTLENTKFKTIDSNRLAEAKVKIHDEVLAAKGGLAEFIAETYSQATINHDADRRWYNPAGWVNAGVVTKEQALPTGQKIAETIAQTVADTATDPEFRDANGKKLADMNKKEYTNAITAEVSKSLLAHEKELGLPVKLTDINPKTQQSYLDDYVGQIRTELDQDAYYEQLARASRLADKVSTQAAVNPTVVADAAAGAKGAGMVGGHEAETPQVQPGGNGSRIQVAQR